MHALLYLITGAAFLSQFGDLVKLLGPAGRLLKVSPDALAMLLFCAVILAVGRNKLVALAPKYVLLALVLLVHMTLGSIVNTVSPGTFVWGMRAYLAFVPLFLLPMVFTFTEAHLRRYFKFVVCLALLQLPVALYQRIFVYPIIPTGDVIRGTFSSGAIMSVTLVSIVGMIIALYLRKQVAGKWLLMIPLLLIPTLINETKGTVILLPLALCAVAYFNVESAKRFKALFVSALASAFFVLAFAVAYDVYFPDLSEDMGKEGESLNLLSFLANDALDSVYKDHDEPKLGRVGRVDSFLYAYVELSKQPVTLPFGLGVGNVSHPDAIEFLRGEHHEFYEKYGAYVTTYASLLWSVGIVGILITLLAIRMMYVDTKFIRESGGYKGALAVGWSATLICLPIAFLYKDLVYANVINVLVFFVSGYFASERVRSVSIHPSRAPADAPALTFPPKA